MPNEIEPAGGIIDSASVKVMRSHDYCHFEVVLGTSSNVSPEEVNELRKTAARLADKAVEQYKIAKRVHATRDQMRDEKVWELEAVKRLETKPETDRTPDEQARIKAYRDGVWAFNHPYSEYDYEDDWDEDEDDE